MRMPEIDQHFEPSPRGRRLAEERKRLKLTLVAMADVGGVSKGSQILYEKGNPPTADYLEAVARSGADVLYILTGQRSRQDVASVVQEFQEMERHEVRRAIALGHGGPDRGDHHLAVGDILPHHAVDADAADFAVVRRYDVNLSAGPGLVPAHGDNSVGSLAFSHSWLKRHGINPAQAGLVRVRGDSMAPTIPDGALVLVHMPERMVHREGVYAFSRGGQVFVKRLLPLERQADGRPERIVVLSDNPASASETLEGHALDDMNIAGRVRCVMTTL